MAAERERETQCVLLTKFKPPAAEKTRKVATCANIVLLANGASYSSPVLMTDTTVAGAELGMGSSTHNMACKVRKKDSILLLLYCDKGGTCRIVRQGAENIYL